MADHELSLIGSSLTNSRFRKKSRESSRGNEPVGVHIRPEQHLRNHHPFNRFNATQNNISSDEDAYFQHQPQPKLSTTVIAVTVDQHNNNEQLRRSRIGLSMDNEDKLVEEDSESDDAVQLSQVNAERARKFAQRLAERSARSKRRITQRPPTPTSSSGSESPTNADGGASSAEQEGGGAGGDASGEMTQQQKQQERMKKKLALIFGDDPLASESGRRAAEQQQQRITFRLFGRKIISFPSWLAIRRIASTKTIAPYSYSYTIWLTLVTAAFLYNAFTIPLRTMFDESRPNRWSWFLCDYVCDLIYLIDLLCFRPLVQFVERGILFESRRDTARHYFTSRLFLIDLVSLLPLDLFYFAVGIVPALRLPRLLKIHCYWECFSRIEAAVSFPNLLRILKTAVYLIYFVHLNAGIYYLISHWEVTRHHEHNRWLLYFYEASQGESSYIRCFFHSLKIAAKIGRNPPPLTTYQRAHQMFSHFVSIFIFAVLVGQIEDIYEAATSREDGFRHKLDKTLRYLTKLKMPIDSIRRTRAWFIYSWKFQKALDENEYLTFLPHKLQTDLAVNVHFNTLAKVTLFHDVEQGLLLALVSSLRPRMYLPGEYVCKKGQVGKEMFIVKYGLVEILGGPQNRTVFATLGEGTVIGEIALLSFAGGDNRRTADVRSKGVSQLFVLSKRHLDQHLEDYPAAERLLKKKAKSIMKQNVARRREAEEKFERELEATTGADHHSGKLNSIGQKQVSPSRFVASATSSNKSNEDDSSVVADADNRGDSQFAKLVIKLLPQAGAIRQKLSTSVSPSARGSAKSSLTTQHEVDNGLPPPLSPARRVLQRQMSTASRARLLAVLHAVRFVSRTAAFRRQSLLSENSAGDSEAVELSDMNNNNNLHQIDVKSNQIEPLFTIEE